MPATSALSNVDISIYNNYQTNSKYLHAAVRMLAEIVLAVTVTHFRISSSILRNHKVGEFRPLLWAVRAMIFADTFCTGVR